MKMKLTTTLNLLRKSGSCTSEYKTLIRALGAGYPHEKPIDLLTILNTNGLEDALWVMCATTENCNIVARLIAADFAELALPNWQKYSKDKRPALAIKAARDFAEGRISQQERDAAGDAAREAGREAARNASNDGASNAVRDAARDAASSAAWAAGRDAAKTATWAAAKTAARSAEGAAARSVESAAARDAAWDAVGDAAWDAVGEAAGDAARSKQREIFISYLQTEEVSPSQL